MHGTKRQTIGSFTIQGEWFPNKTVSFPENGCHHGDETPLEIEMRLFGSATRWAFQRLLEGRTRAEIKVLGQAIFHLNSRYMDDAILKAKEIIDAQRQLIPLEIKETAAKLGKTEKKIKQIFAKVKKL
ncbi:transposase, IS605 OrfB family, partial [mine drainage metagenome]